MNDLKITTYGTKGDEDFAYGVSDGSAGIWWPNEDAQTEIRAATDPETTAIEMCQKQPMRGTWHC